MRRTVSVGCVAILSSPSVVGHRAAEEKLESSCFRVLSTRRGDSSSRGSRNGNVSYIFNERLTLRRRSLGGTGIPFRNDDNILPFSSREQRRYISVGGKKIRGGAGGGLPSSKGRSAGASARSSSATSPTFTRNGPVHLYSTKDNASSKNNRLDDTIDFKGELKNFFRGANKTTVRFFLYMGGILCVFVAFYVYFMESQRKFYKRGLLDPKKKKFKSRLTIVLDLDETLVSFGDKAYRLRAGVVPRPYLAELLDYLVEIDAEVVLWSGGSTRYTQEVLKHIDPNGTKVNHFLARDESWFVPGDPWYEKNLRWLGRPMKDTLMVENRAVSVRGCNTNALVVPDFIRGEYMEDGLDFPHNDRVLLDLLYVVRDLHENFPNMPVDEYLKNVKERNQVVKEIPCHLAMPQLPDELAVGKFYFLGDKYKSATAATNAQLIPGGGLRGNDFFKKKYNI